MGKRGGIFKTIIISLFFLFGCSQKYVNVEGKSLDEKVVASWKELDCKIIEQDEKGFALGVQIKSLAMVEDSVGLRGRSEGSEGVLPLLGSIFIFGGGVGCIFSTVSQISAEEPTETGCLISGIALLTGFAMKLAAAVPSFVKKDTICTDNAILSEQKIKVAVENSDFEKSYYTDTNGNVKLKFDDIIFEPSKADSAFSLIIKYEEMIDTVGIRLR